MSKALIIVDVQHDFIDGSLGVTGGEEVAYKISDFVGGNPDWYDHVVTTQDWHVDPGDHFSETPDFAGTWPAHCVAGTHGAELHEVIHGLEIDERFFKGHLSAAYSGFEGHCAASDGVNYTLAGWLNTRGVKKVDICGIATDYCVKATALDAVKYGYTTRLLVDLCAAVTPDSGREAIYEMLDSRVDIVLNGET